MNEPQNTMPPLALLEEAVAANKHHRAQLTQRIGILRAMCDDKVAEAATLKNRGAEKQAEAFEAEAARLNEQAQILQARVAQLVAEFAGSGSPTASPAPAQRKPWQRPKFWAEVDALAGWLEWLAAACKDSASTVAIANARHMLDVLTRERQTIERDADVDSLDTHLSVLAVNCDPRAVFSLPFYLFVESKDLHAQTEMSHRFVALAKVCGIVPPPATAEAAQVQMDRLAAACCEADAARIAVARKALSGGKAGISRAAQIIAGLSPPDSLRFTQNYLVHMLQDMVAAMPADVPTAAGQD